MTEDRPANAETLAISGCEKELCRLRELFAGLSWSIDTVHTLAEAKEWLTRNRTPVILCESCLPDGDWKAALRLTAGSANSPSLIVMSRLADERLWVDVLSSGGYDVMALPVTRADLFHTLSGAWRSWKARHNTDAVPLCAALN